MHLPHPEILSSLEPGHIVLLDDGKLALRILEATPARAVTEVVTGGRLTDRKGVSVPDTVIPITAMTEKDRGDAEAAVDAGVDWIAVSFVQRPEDVAEVKKLARGQCAVLAKIEKPQAVARFEEIMEIADAVMVARGDLGVELPLEKVPGIQKRITRLTRRTGKPVVIATQMLESMISSPVPTRAEVTDVATAVFEGADAVMLSAESAAGQYPVEAVAMMNRIAEEVESDPNHAIIIAAQRSAPEATRRRRYCRGGALDHRDGGSERHHRLERIGGDRAAHRARAARASHPGAHAERAHGAPTGAGLGRARRGHGRCP